jgi:hypothetical protein
MISVMQKEKLRLKDFPRSHCGRGGGGVTAIAGALPKPHRMPRTFEHPLLYNSQQPMTWLVFQSLFL